MSIDIITFSEMFPKIKQDEKNERESAREDDVGKSWSKNFQREQKNESERAKGKKRKDGKKSIFNLRLVLIRGARSANILLPLSRLLQTNCIINTRAVCSIYTCSALNFSIFFSLFCRLIRVHPAAAAATTTAHNDKKRWKSNIM